MFRKLVSNIRFSPALVGQLAFYANRLRKEEATRRVGLVFIALALVVQSFTIFQPPEPANAANSGDMVYGGLGLGSNKSLNNFLRPYDANTNNLRHIMDYVGVTRQEIANAKYTSWNTQGKLSWGLNPKYSHAQGERAVNVIDYYGTPIRTVYARPMTLANGNTSIYGWVGHSERLGWFAIMQDCGNLVTEHVPPPFTPAPKPTPTNPSISIDKKVDGVEHKEVKVNTPFTYQIAVKNTGDVDLKDVAVADGQPTNVAFTAASKGSIANGMWKYTIPTLKKGETQTFAITAKATKQVAGRIVNTACVDAPGVPTNPNNPDKAYGDDCDHATIEVPPTPPKPPVASAVCEKLVSTITARTSVRLDAAATADNGATISEYRYVVKNNNKTVVSKSVKSTDTRNSIVEKITTPGTYSATVTVKTSVGDKTSQNCTTSFTIAPPEKCPLNPALTINDKECQPCPGDDSLWVKDPACAAQIVKTKEGTNLTTKKPATEAAVKASEELSFTLTARNEGKAKATIAFTDNLDDTLEYAALTNNGGGTYNKETKELSWGTVTLEPGQEVKKTFVVKLQSAITSAPKGISEGSSYDCKLTNVFGNSVTIPVDCPPAKIVEQTVTQLPKTGPTENIIFGSIIFAVAAYFYARSRQLKKEVRLVRRDLNTGTI